jgi:hypothetical protein
LIDPKKRIRLEFRDYVKPGDMLGVDVDLTNSRLLEVKVSTYLDTTKGPVTLDARFCTLNDGTTYPSEVILDAKGKALRVTVQNSGYRISGFCPLI